MKRIYKYYFRYRLENGQTGSGMIKAENKQAAIENAPKRFGHKIDFYNFRRKVTQ